MKSITEVFIYDKVRHVIDTLDIPVVSSNERFDIVLRHAFYECTTYSVTESVVSWKRARSNRTRDEGTIRAADIKDHMIANVEKNSCTHLSIVSTSWSQTRCRSSRDINRVLANEKNDDYTRYHVIAHYDVSSTEVIMRRMTDKRLQVTFRSFVSLENGELPVVEFYKVAKNHACALKHVKNAFSITFPMNQSVLFIQQFKDETLFDIFSEPILIRKPYLEELIEISWHPSNLKNVLDENDSLYSRWNNKNIL